MSAAACREIAGASPAGSVRPAAHGCYTRAPTRGFAEIRLFIVSKIDASKTDKFGLVHGSNLRRAGCLASSVGPFSDRRAFLRHRRPAPVSVVFPEILYACRPVSEFESFDSFRLRPCSRRFTGSSRFAGTACYFPDSRAQRDRPCPVAIRSPWCRRAPAPGRGAILRHARRPVEGALHRACLEWALSSGA